MREPRVPHEVEIQRKDEQIKKLEEELAALKEEQDIDAALIEGRGDATKKFLDMAPQVVQEITAQIIANRDIRARERLRKIMRGIFDAIFADTQANQTPINKKRRTGSTGGTEDQVV